MSVRYQADLNKADATRGTLTGSGHYDTHREQTRGWSAVIAGVCFAALAIGAFGYVLAVRSCDVAMAASPMVP